MTYQCLNGFFGAFVNLLIVRYFGAPLIFFSRGLDYALARMGILAAPFFASGVLLFYLCEKKNTI